MLNCVKARFAGSTTTVACASEFHIKELKIQSETKNKKHSREFGIENVIGQAFTAYTIPTPKP